MSGMLAAVQDAWRIITQPLPLIVFSDLCPSGAVYRYVEDARVHLIVNSKHRELVESAIARGDLWAEVHRTSKDAS